MRLGDERQMNTLLKGDPVPIKIFGSVVISSYLVELGNQWKVLLHNARRHVKCDTPTLVFTSGQAKSTNIWFFQVPKQMSFLAKTYQTM